MITLAVRAAFTALVLSAVSLSALAQAAKPDACQIDRQTLALRFGGEGMLPYVPGSINGMPTMAVIDIGSPYTTLNKAALEKIGVATIDTGERIRGVGGSAPEVIANVNEIAVGPARGKGQFQVMAGSRTEYGINLGTNYLLSTDLELSLAEKALRFVQPTNCGKNYLAYWSADAVTLPFVFGPEERPLFKVKIDGHELTAMLSTAIEQSVIDVQAAASLPGKTAAMFSAEGSTRVRVIGRSTVPAWSSQFKLIEIGDEQISDSKLTVMRLDGIQADVILGLDFLRSHRILISMSQRMLYFTYTGGPLFSTANDVDWLRSEAEAGNADAMYRLGANDDLQNRTMSAEALAWYRKAAATGHLNARQRLAYHDFAMGKFDASTLALRDVFRQRPPSAESAAMLYLAATRSSSRAAATAELKILRQNLVDNDPWQLALLDFHQDKIGWEKLVQFAEADVRQSTARMCEAHFHGGQYLLATGQQDGARVRFGKANDVCQKGSLAGSLASAELARAASSGK
ncbi:aspartyl protease family protein [Massilia sp. PAMC28688]|uniref:pepsin/retropepsin-like aspartic protease family protein n=1 Tax=Massilia sp. PAMC28688 TaxID=2861283 RepID=UPI001C63091A|nr:pepsin/retropepsin-like aspartic protease family protein [Massilia sp. PAMC28688]QYF95481.1 aspartyl protease family protein [Massilia sp. PAMC28688]